MFCLIYEMYYVSTANVMSGQYPEKYTIPYHQCPQSFPRPLELPFMTSTSTDPVKCVTPYHQSVLDFSIYDTCLSWQSLFIQQVDKFGNYQAAHSTSPPVASYAI